MTEKKILLPPNILWSKVKETTKNALEKGALQPIATDYEVIEENGIPFIVRIVSNLARKQQAQKKVDKDFNPFLPYEEELFVADISDTHLCLLNKYNVMDYHLLIVTRAFEKQEDLLNLSDFMALWAALEQFDGLAFYNGGKIAGASVRHKHLQIIPVSLDADIKKIPIESVIEQAVYNNYIGHLPAFTFNHAFTKLNYNEKESIYQISFKTLECYCNLLKAVGLFRTEENQQSGPYNLLMTREWMLLVPRTQEFYQSISVNSLGFAGGLLVRDRQQLELVKDTLPMNILKSVAQSK